MTRFFATLAVLLPLLLGLTQPFPSSAAAAADLPDGVPTGAVKATAGIPDDGDKFKVNVGSSSEVVLLLLTDAPEPGECYHQQSEAHLRKLMPPDSTVYLVADPAAEDRDGKNRLLRHAYIPGEDDGDDWRSLNLTMIEDGYAGYREMDDASLHSAEYMRATSSARSADRGLWGQCGGELHSDRIPADATNTPKPSRSATVRTTTSRPTATADAPANVADCSPFADYDEAQAYYAANPGAQPVIDPDLDGYACEVYFGVDPTGGVATGGGGGGGTTVDAPAAPTGSCDPSYPTVCIPPYSQVGDLDCPDIPYGYFVVLPPDPHGLDGNDNDGYGCESN